MTAASLLQEAHGRVIKARAAGAFWLTALYDGDALTSAARAQIAPTVAECKEAEKVLERLRRQQFSRLKEAKP